MKRIRTNLGGLDAIILEPEGGARRPDVNVILCHGFGAPGEDLVGLGPELAQVSPELSSRVRWIFPHAPLSLDAYGAPGGRAWWLIDMEAMLGQRNWDRFVEEVPEGLPKARRMLTALVEEIGTRTEIPSGRTVLGGFSQGAMLTTDLALRLEEPPLGLGILSGTLISRLAWTERAPKRRGLPVFQSHGRQDPILPFEVSERLRKLLEESGLNVEFTGFNGPHTISMGVLTQLGRWLEARIR